jgi:hypothetical protein
VTFIDGFGFSEGLIVMPQGLRMERPGAIRYA